LAPVYIPSVWAADSSSPLTSTIISAPASTVSTTVTLPAIVSFPSGTGEIELWERFKAGGASDFGPWTMSGTTHASIGTQGLSSTLTSGLGTYEFYSVAIDAGVSAAREAVPSSADTVTRLIAAP
jgi:hypothetical protein